MGQKIKESEQHYDRIATYYIKENILNVIRMENYLLGYNLYCLGKKLGYEMSAKLLEGFLLGAEVELKTEKDKRAYQIIHNIITSHLEEEEINEKQEEAKLTISKLCNDFLEQHYLNMISNSDFIVGYEIFELCRIWDCKEEIMALGTFLHRTLIDHESSEEIKEVNQKRERIRLIIMKEETK